MGRARPVYDNSVGGRPYDGPFRHLHLRLAENPEGFLLWVSTFEVAGGKRRHVVTYPPIPVSWADRPRSESDLLFLAAEQVRRYTGA